MNKMNNLIRLQNTSGRVVFEDSIDHFQNGVLRLLQESEAKVSKFLKKSGTNIFEKKLSTLPDVIFELNRLWTEITLEDSPKNSFNQKSVNFQTNSCFGNEIIDTYIPLKNKPNLWIGINSMKGFGLLMEDDQGTRVRHSVTKYESEYFEGKQEGLGYGNLKDQFWRVEKSEKQVELVSQILKKIRFHKKLANIEILDVGSGYGTFLNATKKFVKAVRGLDVSMFAASQAESQFAIQTEIKTLAEYAQKTNDKYDLITMWDYIEHPDDPFLEINLCRKLLNKDGLLLIKTPNVNALERYIFGSDYHSFKEEHLHYFSLQSLTTLLSQCGFSVKYSEGVSHLFKGITTIDLCKEARLAGMESDLIIVAQMQDNSF
jgi:2-polyprenyl-3-methyl-5-hydroxy-6-metoxy-1,4-benzoquinol methylase